MTIFPQYRIYMSFFLFAMASGSMTSRLPDIQEHLAVTQGELGLTLIGMAIGTLISLTFSTPLITHLGSRNTALITVIGTATCFAAVSWMPTAPLAFAVLFVNGLLAGAFEINLNVEIDRLEAADGGRYMNRAHGCWSLGFFISALLGAGIRQLGLPVTLHLALVSGAAILVGASLLYGMIPAPVRPSSHQGKAPRIAFPTIGLMPLCFIGIAAFLIEGAGLDWSAIYMRDVFQSVPFIGGLGLTLFGFCMAVVRLTIDPVVTRFGSRMVAASLLVIAIVGALLVVYAAAEWQALVGFGLLGIGSSAVYPLAVSAAAQRTDRPSAVNVAAISQVTFVIFFVAPPLLGFVAQYWGIRNSYLATLPILIIGLIATKALPGRTAAPADLDVALAEPRG